MWIPEAHRVSVARVRRNRCEDCLVARLDWADTRSNSRPGCPFARFEEHREIQTERVREGDKDEKEVGYGQGKYEDKSEAK